MHPDKSPGPGGFNLVFYKNFWGVVGNDIFAACCLWNNEGQFLVGLNDTVVTLIPKCDKI